MCPILQMGILRLQRIMVLCQWLVGGRERSGILTLSFLSPLPHGETAAQRAASRLSPKIAFGVVFIDRLQH